MERKHIAKLVGEKSVNETVDTINSFLHENNYKVKTSSNRSIVFVTNDITIKVFSPLSSIDSEIHALESIHSPYVINMINSVNTPNIKIIVYQTVKPIKNLPDTLTELIKLLCDISKGLLAIHLQGFIHGDTGLGNIGLTKDNNWSLYDFEDVKESNSPEDQYKDVYIFLSDLHIAYKNINSPLRKVVELLKIYMKNMYTKETVTTRMFLGKPRKRIDRVYTYSIGEFNRLLEWITDEKC